MNKEKVLSIDYQTIVELEILKPSGIGKNIFDILDRTTTIGGKDMLKSKFRRPSSDLKEIVSIQNAVKFITENRIQWDIKDFKPIIDQVEFYYYSKADIINSESSVGIFFEGLYFHVKSKLYRKTINSGAKNAIHLVLKFYDYYAKNKSGKLPGYIQNIFSELEKIFTIAPISRILKKGNNHSWNLSELFQFDRVFRDLNKMDTLRLINLFYEIDVLLSKADATKEMGLAFPEFVDSELAILEINDVYHLFLKKPVENTVAFKEGKNFLFLTGPNMAGKTTFLKSSSIAVFLAHQGMGVPATSMRLTAFGALFSSLNTSDNLSIGYSYFYSEVMRVKQAAETLKDHSKTFMVFDELFKGTNVKDAFDGSVLVIDGLVNWMSSVFILSSHLLEIEKKIEKHPNIFYQYFDSNIQDGKPEFNFKLKKGLSDERLGLLILKNENIDKLLQKD